MIRRDGEPMFTGTDGKKHYLSKFKDGTYQLLSEAPYPKSQKPKHILGRKWGGKWGKRKRVTAL